MSAISPLQCLEDRSDHPGALAAQPGKKQFGFVDWNTISRFWISHFSSSVYRALRWFLLAGLIPGGSQTWRFTTRYGVAWPWQTFQHLGDTLHALRGHMHTWHTWRTRDHKCENDANTLNTPHRFLIYRTLRKHDLMICCASQLHKRVTTVTC